MLNLNQIEPLLTMQPDCHIFSRRRQEYSCACQLIRKRLDFDLQVNNILSSIKKRKSMDTIVLSLVASACVFLILIYWLTKWEGTIVYLQGFSCSACLSAQFYSFVYYLVNIFYIFNMGGILNCSFMHSVAHIQTQSYCSKICMVQCFMIHWHQFIERSFRRKTSI